MREMLKRELDADDVIKVLRAVASLQQKELTVSTEDRETAEKKRTEAAVAVEPAVRLVVAMLEHELDADDVVKMLRAIGIPHVTELKLIGEMLDRELDTDDILKVLQSIQSLQLKDLPLDVFASGN
jgi:hypothetical protein